jgi:predicted branched-subunit amino acid permease
LLTDEAYAIVIVDYQKTPNAPRKYQHYFYLGAGLAEWTSWQISTAVGIFLGAQAPAELGLDFTLALTFIALLVPALRDRPGALAALAAGVIAVLTYNWPYKLGLMTAALAGIVAGLAAERIGRAERERSAWKSG